MHRAALALQQPAFATHQLAQHAFHRRAARQRVVMAAIGAERPVVFLHRRRKASRDCLLPKCQMRRALDQVLQEQIIGALFNMADFQQRAPQGEPCVLTNIVIRARSCFALRSTFGRGLGA